MEETWRVEDDVLEDEHAWLANRETEKLARLLDDLRARYPEAMSTLQKQWGNCTALCDVELLSALMAGHDLETARAWLTSETEGENPSK